MKQRTQNIVNVIKNPPLMGYEAGDMESAVIRYMSEECACPIEYYTDDIVIGILKEAFADFISCCDNPEYYVRDLMDYLTSDNIMHKPRSLKEAIITVLDLVQVKRDGENGYVYINGFNDGIEELDIKITGHRWTPLSD